MRLQNKLFAICVWTFVGHSALAASYFEDLQNLRTALEISNFSSTKLNDYKNPLLGQNQFQLPEKKAPWAGNFFPMKDSGLANRWQSPQKLASLKDLYTKDSILKMTAEEISKLSPIEKYDILMQDYGFSATRHEMYHRGPLRDVAPEAWEGFCNGVRAAGIILPEPQRPIVIKNADGVAVEMNIADLKALAGASYFYVENYAQMGGPSNKMADNQPNAAVFDLTIRYFLGEKKRAFIIDAHLGNEIWNESVVGYTRKVSAKMELSPEEKMQFPRAAEKVKVDLVLQTLGEVDIAGGNRKTQADVAAKRLNQQYPISTGYFLYLDAKGEILDGKWVNGYGTRGVDFAWFGSGKGMDSAYSNYGQSGNAKLDFSVIKKFFKKASLTMTCKNVHTL